MLTSKVIIILSGIKLKKDYFAPLYETGVAYQIQDDLSDFLGLKDRGLPGRDLKEGKMNILIMHFIENASNGEKFILQKFLKKDMTQFLKKKLVFGLKELKKKEHLILLSFI